MKSAELLRKTVDAEASDLFIVAGSPASIKVDGSICPIAGDKLMPPNTQQIIEEIYEIAGRSMDDFLKCGDDDFSFSMKGVARFRVNAFRQRSSLAAVIRVMSFSIPNWQEIGIPKEVMELADASGGLVLFTGTAGSGKSTTQACLVDQINKTHAYHVVTIEDPIEYLHKNNKSIVSQREISVDTEDYLTALRACLRQVPDVILLGEMRDHEAISTAMTAAETGHLVYATLHTRGVSNAVDRIIDTFPANQQMQIRSQLSMVLSTVVSQQLLPGKNGKIVPAFEIVHCNTAIRNLLRENKIHQIHGVVASLSKEGMITMDQSIRKLFDEGKITREVAVEYADNPEQMKRWVE